MTRKRLAVLALSGLAVLGAAGFAMGPASAEESSVDTSAYGHQNPGPVVVGHRGAPGYRPEHTLASYELAFRMGANWVDVDLVPTKDGRLVARHEPEIGGTTDVANHPEFASRKKTQVIDGATVTGWFTQDFTLAELKTLRAVERIPQFRPDNQIYNGRYQVAEYQEILDLAHRLSRELHRTVGTYPEVKHSTYFQAIGNPVDPKLADILKRNGLDRKDAPVIIQSFEVSNLIDLHRELKVPLLQLTDSVGAPADFVAKGDKRTYADLVTAQGLREVAKYATYLGPSKAQIIPLDAAGDLTTPTALIHDAHAAGLRVQPYTFRNENNFLPANMRSSATLSQYGNIFAEETAFLKAGVDGLFADQADTALEAIKAFTGH